MSSRCKTIWRLIKRLNSIQMRIEEDMQAFNEAESPELMMRIIQNFLEAYGLSETIRFAHLPRIEPQDRVTASVLVLRFERVITKIFEDQDAFQRMASMRTVPMPYFPYPPGKGYNVTPAAAAAMN